MQNGVKYLLTEEPVTLVAPEALFEVGISEVAEGQAGFSFEHSLIAVKVPQDIHKFCGVLSSLLEHTAIKLFNSL